MDTHAECHTAQPETGTDRRSHVFGELQTKPPDSVTDRDTLTRRYALSSDGQVRAKEPWGLYGSLKRSMAPASVVLVRSNKPNVCTSAGPVMRS